MVVRQLADFGYQALEAEDGAAALRILAEHETDDLLFTDVVMPGGMQDVDPIVAACAGPFAARTVPPAGGARPAPALRHAVPVRPFFQFSHSSRIPEQERSSDRGSISILSTALYHATEAVGWKLDRYDGVHLSPQCVSNQK